jgi:hypothetical protein
MQHSLYQLVEIFPEAKPYVKSKLQREIKQWKEDLKEAQKIKTECKKVTSRALPKNQWFWEMVAEILIIPDRGKIEKQIKKNVFHLSALKPQKMEEIKDGKVTEQDIIKAKETPITNFLEVNRMGFARCPFHKDDHPSLKVYKNNRWWCYSCNTGSDVIDLIMAIQKVDFIEAVKYLT